MSREVKISEETWEAYCRTIIQFHPYGAPVEQRINIQPEVAGGGDWVWGESVSEVFVLSPENPYSQRLTYWENLYREVDLVKLVKHSGINFENCLGMSPDEDWVERSLLLWNVDRELVQEWGARFEQNAYFRLTPNSFEVISLVDDRYSKTGWRSQLIKSDDFEEDYLGVW